MNSSESLVCTTFSSGVVNVDRLKKKVLSVRQDVTCLVNVQDTTGNLTRILGEVKVHLRVSENYIISSRILNFKI